MGLVLFFYRLGTPGLMDPDEGRYAEIGREMLALKDWLVPHLNHLPYLEKPPLVYWLTALSFKTLGLTEFAARLPAAVSALGGLFLAYALGRAFWGPAAGLLGAAVLATCPGYVALGRILTLDMVFALFLNLAVGLGYLALSRERPRWWLWAYAALGLAVLIKGPVAVVLAGLIWGLGVGLHPHPNPPPSRGREKGEVPPGPAPHRGRGPAPGPASRFGRIWQPRTWQVLWQPQGWLLMAVIVLPWFFYVQWRHPEFFRFFILEHHLGRFLTPAIHPEPFYYYAPVVLGLMLPWSFLLPWALAFGGRPRDPHRAFLLIWAAVVLVFFSLSRGKLVPYILPALLPLALLLGAALNDCREARRFARDRGLHYSLLVWGLAGLALTALYFWPPAALSRELAKAAPMGSLVPAGLLGFALTPLAALLRRQVGVLLLGALLLNALAPQIVETVSRGRSPREVGLAVRDHWQPGAALVGVQLYSQGVSFYSGQVFHLLEFGTELDFGRRLRPASGLFFTDLKELTAFAASRPRSFFYLKVQDLPRLEREFPGKLRPLSRYKDCILLGYEGK